MTDGIEYLAGVIAYQVAWWYTAKAVWTLGLHQLNRNIKRRELREAVCKEKVQDSR